MRIVLIKEVILIRKTKQRAVLEGMLVDQKVHYTPQDLLKKIDEDHHGSISQATLYRTLSDMEANGEIQSITLSNRTTIYDGNTTPHAHFQCMDCGQVMDIDDLPNDWLESIQRKYGLTIDHQSIILYGYCEHCAKERR